MSIAFNVLPDTVRVPFAYAEFDGSGASDDPALMPYTVLMVGQMLDSGTAEAGTVQRPMSAAQAATLFGEGSQLAAMCAAYLNANSITKMLAIGVKDAEEGTAAKGALTINGTCVNAAPLCLYINGKLVRAAAPLAAEASAVAENLTNAINADKSLPVTATFSGGEVSLTARHKGECGNDIDLRISYYDEDKPGGLTFSFTQMTGGAGNPDPAPVIAAMANDQYHVIAWPWTDSASLAALHDELADRWGPLRQIDGQAIVVKRGSYGDVTTFAGERNDKHLTVFASEGSPTSPWEDAAATAGVIAYYGNSDPARGFNTLLVPGVLAPAPADRWTDFPEKNQALFEGVSTRYVAPDGKGGMVLLKAGVGTASGSLRQGQNILSAEGQFDMADRFSDYIVKGQKPGTDKGWGKDACAVRGQYRDQAVQRYRPMLIRAEQSGDSSNAHQRAAWECSVRAARAVTVTATVQGFRQQGVGREQSGPLWQLNQMADVDLPYLRISQRLLVAGVEFRRDATSGSTTRLTLRDPAAFKPEPQKEEKGGSGSGGGDAKMEKEVDLQTRLAQDAAARQKAIK